MMLVKVLSGFWHLLWLSSEVDGGHNRCLSLLRNQTIKWMSTINYDENATDHFIGVAFFRKRVTQGKRENNSEK